MKVAQSYMRRRRSCREEGYHRSAAFVGLDVHAETIAAAIAEKDQAARDLGTIPNRQESIRKLARKLSEGGAWAACYEAGYDTPRATRCTGN